MKKTATEFLLDLIAIPSVSPMSNKPVVDYVTKVLDGHHWNVQLYPYTDPAGVEKYNLIAMTGNAPDNRACLAFVCHTDTVPFDASWAEAVHPLVTEGRVYGRGSCDVKGFLACVLATLGQIDIEALKEPLALVLTADEEVGCVGAKHLAAINAFSAQYMIIGEPTGLRPVRAGKGYSLATITVRGKEAHSAFLSIGRSAIYDAAHVLTGLERLAVELESENCDRGFEPPFTTLNAGLIEGGTAKNIIPGECRITVEWRPVPGQDPNRVADLIRGMLVRLAATRAGFSAELTLHRTDPAFPPSETSQVSEMLEVLSGNRPTTISFGSEASHLRALTKESVVFGPGDMRVAHRTGEYVAEADLCKCVSYLRTTVENICL